MLQTFAHGASPLDRRVPFRLASSSAEAIWARGLVSETAARTVPPMIAAAVRGRAPRIHARFRNLSGQTAWWGFSAIPVAPLTFRRPCHKRQALALKLGLKLGSYLAYSRFGPRTEGLGHPGPGGWLLRPCRCRGLKRDPAATNRRRRPAAGRATTAGRSTGRGEQPWCAAPKLGWLGAKTPDCWAGLFLRGGGGGGGAGAARGRGGGAGGGGGARGGGGGGGGGPPGGDLPSGARALVLGLRRKVCPGPGGGGVWWSESGGDSSWPPARPPNGARQPSSQAGQGLGPPTAARESPFQLDQRAACCPALLPLVPDLGP